MLVKTSRAFLYCNRPGKGHIIPTSLSKGKTLPNTHPRKKGVKKPHKAGKSTSPLGGFLKASYKIFIHKNKVGKSRPACQKGFCVIS
nr:MAG TPA: hypothetical protein [Caudoviricetes sp.]